MDSEWKYRCAICIKSGCCMGTSYHDMGRIYDLW